MTIEKTEYSFPDEQDDAQDAAGSETEIEIIDDTPVADRGRKPMIDPPKELTDEELGKYDEGVKKRIQHFTKGYHEERRAKETAQREKDEALRIAQAIVEENKQLRGSLSEGNTALINQAKVAAESELASAERQYKEAAEAFDTEAMLAAQKKMMAATMKNERMAQLRPEAFVPQSKIDTSQLQAKPAVDSRLAEWKEDNQWFGENKRMTAYALGLHEDLVAEGVAVGSESYYKRLNADIRTRFADQFEQTDDASGSSVDAKPQRRSNVVAPATRSTAPKKVVLTKTQVNTAKRLGVPLELYARKVAELMRS